MNADEEIEWIKKLEDANIKARNAEQENYQKSLAGFTEQIQKNLKTIKDLERFIEDLLTAWRTTSNYPTILRKEVVITYFLNRRVFGSTQEVLIKIPDQVIWEIRKVTRDWIAEIDRKNDELLKKFNKRDL